MSDLGAAAGTTGSSRLLCPVVDNLVDNLVDNAVVHASPDGPCGGDRR
ncbi:hypothetical protein H9I49_17320 [Terrabacter sp. MAHUQ-38]|nr:hypothetical protein [Terrabacter sp. MAHUQ-38]